MNITINREKKEIQIEEPVNLGELITELNSLLGVDWANFTLSFTNKYNFIPYYPQPSLPYYPDTIPGTHVVTCKNGELKDFTEPNLQSPIFND